MIKLGLGKLLFFGATVTLGGCLDAAEGRVGADAVADTDTDTDADAVADTDTDTDTVADTVAVADTATVTDTDTDTATVADTDTDTDAVADTDTDTVASDPCEGPLRISPREGPAAGGTLVYAEGQEFYIGALTWMMKIGDAPATEMIIDPDPGFAPCRVAFRTEPSAAGTFDVAVYYGWGEPNDTTDPRYGLAGEYTYR
ncbi:MAG: IPT/TIG domain-containing protein [Deltaproteobacteria bacterium]|nr:IPT/TIG domain-containing protein [Deltaproteobacteria bacterium]